jgi:hypothetical protein
MMLQFFKKKPFLLKVRLVWILLIIFIILIFFFLKIVPLGKATYIKNYSHTFKLGKGFINNFTPVVNVNQKEDSSPRIIKSPVYFSVFTPRTFSRAKLIIKYRSNLTRGAIIEAGALVSPATADYNLQPLELVAPDTLSADFNLKEVYRSNGKYVFTISIPSLEIINSPDYLEISEVKIEFSGRNLYQKIFDISD